MTPIKAPLTAAMHSTWNEEMVGVRGMQFQLNHYAPFCLLEIIEFINYTMTKRTQ